MKPSHQGTSSDLLKRKLLFAAERVVAQRGFAGATVREIHEAAGTRNTSAIHYHFGSLEHLLAGVFNLRSAPLAIDSCDRHLNVIDIVTILVQSLAQFLTPSPDGNFYLRFLERAAIEHRLARTYVPVLLVKNWRMAEDLLRRIMVEEAALSPWLADTRIDIARGHFISSLAQVEVWIESDPREAVKLSVLVQVVIDSTVAIITAPVSEALSLRLMDISCESRRN